MNPILKALIRVVLIIIILAIVFSSLGVVIEAGHVGVLRTLGAVQPEPLGWAFI
jgi:hypothetical protein